MIRQRPDRQPMANGPPPRAYQSPSDLRQQQQQPQASWNPSRQQHYSSTTVQESPSAPLSRSCMPTFRLGRRRGSSAGSRSSRSSIKSREQRAVLETPNWESFGGGGDGFKAVEGGKGNGNDGFQSPGLNTTTTTATESPTFSPFTSSMGSSSHVDTSEDTEPRSNTESSRNGLRTSSSSSLSMNLLSPPAPSDRSIRNRAAYEAQQRRRGVYDGEMEPQGVRGQEAPTVRSSPSQAPLTGEGGVPSMRSFGSGSTSAGSRMVVTPVAKSRSKPSMLYGSLMEEDEEDEGGGENAGKVDHSALVDRKRQSREPDENSHMQFSPETGRAVHFTSSTEEDTRTPLQRNTPGYPVHKQLSEEPSTDSDEELQNLKQDLIPDLPVVPQHPRGRTPTHESRSMSGFADQRNSPSPAAAAAAASAGAVNAAGRPGQPSNDESLDSLNQKAMQYVKAQDYDRALHVFLQVLQKRKTKYGAHHSSVASDYHNLGTVHSKRSVICEGTEQQKCRQQALECFQAAARTARDALGRNHPNVAVSLVRIGFLLMQSQQYQSSVITFREALRIRVAHFGEQHGLVANLYNNLGVCHMHMGQFPEGREQLDGAMNIQRNILKAEPKAVHWLELADTLFNIGGLCLEWIRRQGPDARRAADAEEAFDECLTIRLRYLGPRHPSVRQVEDLLEMALSVARPPGQASMARSSVSQGHSVAPSLERSINATKSPGNPGKRMSAPSPNGNRPPLAPQALPFESQVSRSPAARRPLSGSTASRPFDESIRGDAVGNDQVFRSAPTPSPQSNKSAPMIGITVSRDSTEEERNTSRQTGGGTNVFLASQLIPEHSPIKAPRVDISSQTLNGSALEDSFKNDISEDTKANGVTQSFSYDAEENCLISDSGIDSEHGRIHFPITWNKAGIAANQVDSSSPGVRDIMVSRPFRSRVEVNRTDSSSSDRWGSETVDRGDADGRYYTGNSERDSVMARARAILVAHQEGGGDRRDLSNETLDMHSSMNSDTNDQRTTLDTDLMEDGVAPLGGNWPESSLKPTSINEMVRDPMSHMQIIHYEATEFLKNHNYIEAIRLFDLILQCQQRRNGPVHADVGSALHNVGIAQLRAQNHEEALKAFEEAARVRKGAVGRDHPLVAVTLVKVGIVLLLLRRFEDALWSFREALSVRKHALGPLHPSTARIYNNIGCVYVEFNEFREARRAFEAALDIQRNALSQDQDSGPLMFGTATTLCNLGYLYRYRDMHAKAALVLKEASELQEAVLGQSHSTVLSTLDNLADSYASGGHAADALHYYNIVVERFRAGEKSGTSKVLRAEAVLLYKMSRVHRQRNDLETQLETLKSALRLIRMYTDSSPGQGTDTLERRIQCDVRACREEMEKNDLKWI